MAYRKYEHFNRKTSSDIFHKFRGISGFSKLSQPVVYLQLIFLPSLVPSLFPLSSGIIKAKYLQ
jgi:hypothetical protein